MSKKKGPTVEARHHVHAVTTMERKAIRERNSVPSRTKPVTPDDAREIVERFISSHFDKPRPAEKARFSIPAEPNRDDDFGLERFVVQYEALLSALLSEVDLYRRRDMMPQAEMLARFKAIDELKIEALLAAGAMQGDA